MASEDQIKYLIKELEKAPPSENFKLLDKNDVGIEAILKFLKENNEVATAGEISENIHISTARTAVLLKKMVAKNYVIRTSDPNDGRLVIVKLTPEGRERARYLKEQIYKAIELMIDNIGMEKLLRFAEISAEINNIFKNQDLDI